MSNVFLHFFVAEVIVRSGSPHFHADLRRVSAQSCRSIIILADRSYSSPDVTDVSSVRTVMSLRGLDAPANGHIVCEVCDIDNEELITLVGKSHVETVVSHDIVGRLMIQCAREQGLSGILDHLLGFDGSEFYISDWGDKLVGKTFSEVMLLFEDAIVLGIYKAEVDEAAEAAQEGEDGELPSKPPRWNNLPPPSHKLFSNLTEQDNSFRDTSSLRYTNIATRMLLNPPDSEVFGPGDQVIVLAEDNDTYQAATEPMPIDKARMNSLASIGVHDEPRAEKMLFIGKNKSPILIIHHVILILILS